MLHQCLFDMLHQCPWTCCTSASLTCCTIAALTCSTSVPWTCFTSAAFVSDIAIFVLKRDVKLQLTNQCRLDMRHQCCFDMQHHDTKRGGSLVWRHQAPSSPGTGQQSTVRSSVSWGGCTLATRGFSHFFQYHGLPFLLTFLCSSLFLQRSYKILSEICLPWEFFCALSIVQYVPQCTMKHTFVNCIPVEMQAMLIE